MQDVWRALSTLGDSRWLLPMAAVLLLTLPRSEDRFRWRWLLAISATATITLGSKLAFMGWGWGIHSLHFTGFSGHTAMSSVAYPVVGAMLAGEDRRARAIGVASGCLLAAAIAWSRIPLQAHSLSEVIAGLVLGLGWATWALRARHPTRRPAITTLLLAVLAGMALPISLPDLHTHKAVVSLAKTLSGRAEIFQHY